MIIFLWWLYYGLQLIWWLCPGWSDSQYKGRQRASPQDNACKSSVLFVILRIVFFMPSLFLWFLFFHLRVAPTLTESLSIDVYTRLAWGYMSIEIVGLVFDINIIIIVLIFDNIIITLIFIIKVTTCLAAAPSNGDSCKNYLSLSNRCQNFHFPIYVKTFTFK